MEDHPIWVFPKIGAPQNGWLIMENTIKMDDLGEWRNHDTVDGRNPAPPEMCKTLQIMG